MSVLDREIRQVQNEAIGAMLLWRFVSAFQIARADAAPCPLPMLFLVLPILLNDDSARHVRSTQVGSGLRSFAAKFLERRSAGTDHLLAIHERAQAMRRLSFSSLLVAIEARLLAMDVPSAAVLALSRTRPRIGVAESVRLLGRDAEKLGAWCADLTPHEVSAVLKVRF